MSDEAHVIRNINWREVFPFTHIFRSFRVAIHPSKLLLALTALIVLYVGGRALDGLWPSRHRAVPGEVDRYQAFMLTGERGSFTDERLRARRDIEEEYAATLMAAGIHDKMDAAQADAREGRRLGDLKKKIIEQRDKDLGRRSSELGRTTRWRPRWPPPLPTRCHRTTKPTNQSAAADRG